MQAIEFETQIDKNGHIFLPEKFRHAYGKSARLLVFLPEQAKSLHKRRHPGSAKGILRILFEDDEHLDDFKAYMPCPVAGGKGSRRQQR
jgi:bifunctional DNA-binding transcriptional regulator/antitoxin component of YhaV-PrlF toxin-antitoxin module